MLVLNCRPAVERLENKYERFENGDELNRLNKETVNGELFEEMWIRVTWTKNYCESFDHVLVEIIVNIVDGFGAIKDRHESVDEDSIKGFVNLTCCEDLFESLLSVERSV